ncbi:ExeA family protein [Legionella bononiensis]|uniref:AAA family ATPase n=1 Tax=Legionella bononiensis TaxID=2793102 RepID=A0ABS1WBE3_9GAMM|nr:AAA family ATPase [Legionella bononiensis]MBL7480962.1 AAA family ATPase [Legionella bononiensis]MBL7526670.1 AAA family ATPase [Legionella bononiensis]MBL7564077.1 AAA family ATPase [Legionella bononiensis]
MYLEHFRLTKAPFTLTPNTEFFCELPSHQEALNVLLLSLSQGEGFIKIVGEIGTGKTLICRILLNSLKDEYVTAYIPNPDQTADGLRFAVASELGVKPEENWTQYQLLEAINQRLLDLHRAGKKTVLIIDEAQALPDSCLEAVRLLTNLETEERKLLQVVLFGQPELDVKLAQINLRQLKQRFTFSYELQPLARGDLDKYLSHRLAKAGYTYGCLFTSYAKRRLYKASGGLPRLLNILCHKSLLVAYGQGKSLVNSHAVNRAIADTESSELFLWRPYIKPFLGIGAMGVLVFFIMIWYYGLTL